MAYGTKYQLPFSSPTTSGTVYLKKEDYTGAVTTLRIAGNGTGLEFHSELSDWFNPIIQQKLIIKFINDGADFFDYIDLFELEERQFQVLLEMDYTSETITVFEGWVNSEIIQQKYINKSIVTLSATNYVSKLEYHFDTDIDTLNEISLIDFINKALLGTGKSDNVRLNCQLWPEGTNPLLYSANTAFADVGLFSEIFWKNNIERYNSLEVIQTILKTFDCFIYWWDGYWIIERYRDIYAGSINYNQYTITNSYSYGDGVSEFSRTNEITDIWDLVWENMEQTIFMIPGYNEFRILLNQKLFLNLTINDFTEGIEQGTTKPDPPRRGWLFWTGNDYESFGASKDNIINSIYRLGEDMNPSWFDPGSVTDPAYWEYQRGITTMFKITNLDSGNLSLNLRWKYQAVRTTAGKDPEEHKFLQYYYLRIKDTDNYIYYNTDDDEWQLKNYAYEKDCCNVSSSMGTALYNEDNKIYEKEYSISIPLDEVTDLPVGDISFILMIGLNIIRIDNGADVYTYGPAGEAYFGDVLITINTDNQENLIKGTLANNVLQSKEINIDIFDSDNLNYKNALLTNTNYVDRVEKWVEGDEVADPVHTLAEWLLIGKFQLFNKNRKKIKGRIKTNRILRPYELFYDSKDATSDLGDKKYILGSYIYYPALGEYEVTLMEYNNEDSINLV